MQIGRTRFGAQLVAAVAVVAALNVVSDSFVSLPEYPSGVWYSWNFMVGPLTGIVLGSWAGFTASFVGVMIGHYINFVDPYEFFFTVGAPIGAAVSALLFSEKWKPVLLYYVALFAAFFASPVAWQLPFWGMWDTYVAFAVLVVVILWIRRGVQESGSKKLPLMLAAAAFVGLEADVLFRIFVFVPCGTYRLFYDFDVALLQFIWVEAAVITPVKVALSTIATVLIGHPLVKAIKKAGFQIHS